MFKWAEDFASWLVFDIFGFAKGSHFGEALNFFFYDSIKITFLLVVIIFLMGIINSYFPIEKVRNFLSRKNMGIDLSTRY